MNRDSNRFCCLLLQIVNGHTKGGGQFWFSSQKVGWYQCPCALPTEAPGIRLALLDLITITHCHFTFTHGETLPANCHHPAQITPLTISTVSLCLWVPAGAVCNIANSHMVTARQTPRTGISHPNILETINGCKAYLASNIRVQQFKL